MDIKAIIILAFTFCVFLTLYSFFFTLPGHKKRLHAASDEEERNIIKPRIIVDSMGTAAMILLAIFFAYMYFHVE